MTQRKQKVLWQSIGSKERLHEGVITLHAYHEDGDQGEKRMNTIEGEIRKRGKATHRLSQTSPSSNRRLLFFLFFFFYFSCFDIPNTNE